MSKPFTAAQERRIREIVREERQSAGVPLEQIQAHLNQAEVRRTGPELPEEGSRDA